MNAIPWHFSATQATDFVANWEIVSHQRNTPSGFSATLFRNRETGEFVYANRGTEPGIDDLVITDGGDIVTDGLAIKQIVDMYNDWQRIQSTGVYQAAKLNLLLEETTVLKADRLATPFGVIGAYELSLRSRNDVIIDMPSGFVYTIEMVASDQLFTDERATGAGIDISGGVTAVGHSLGGHLAAAFSRLFSDCSNALTINGAGFMTGILGGLSGNAATNIGNLFAMLGGAGSFDSSKILNLYGDKGIEFTTMNNSVALGQQGGHQGIYIESISGSNTVGHGKEQMTDALAVYDLFIRLDERFQTDDFQAVFNELTPIFNAMATGRDELATYENIVNIFGELFVDNYKAISGWHLGSREDLYQAIKEIRDEISDKNLHVTSLVKLSEPEIASLAKTQGDSGLAARYALVNLNPFTITGESNLYDRFNETGELDIHTATQEDGDLSEQFIEDRAKFLHYLTHSDATVSNFNPDINFVDNRLGISLEVDNGMIGLDADSQYLFGNLEDELLEGGSAIDHLYGMDGDDILIGNGNNDFLEGGKGRDTLNGGSGNDIFGIIGEDIAYDNFIGGSGLDSIQGTAGNDTIRVNLFNDTSSIETIVGGGGTDIIAGTDGNDTIDLSKTKLTGIARVEGGAGSDIIKGTDAADHLYGTALGIPDDGAEDHLEGGAGNDEYHIGQGDMIRDSDGQGTIWFGTAKISGLTLARKGGNGLYIQNNGGISASYDSASMTLQVFDLSEPVPLSFTVENFSSGNYGIALKEEQPANLDRILTGTASHDEMGLLDFGSDSKNWQLTYTAFPNGSSNTPFYQEGLAGVAPRMQITGGAGSDFLFGFARHDEISGGDGGDIIIGDMGSYNGKPITLTGTPEGDLLDGGSGNDWLQGSGEVDQLIGGQGNDLLSGFDGKDILIGDKDNDVLAGGSHADVLLGGDGDDILLGEGYFTGTGTLTLDNLASFGVDFAASATGYYTGYVSRNFTIHNDAPNGGNDILTGGTGRDWLDGGSGKDILDGGVGSDSLFGGADDDKLYGGDGNDWLVGDSGDLTGAGNDILNGGDGDDLLYGLGGNDRLMGDNGTDKLYGFEGDDTLSGGSGSDYLDGAEGTDILEGGSGEDELYGGSGNDTLVGGSGNDAMYGDDGTDIYLLGRGSGFDFIANSGGSDRIRFGQDVADSQLQVVQVRRVGESGILEHSGNGQDLWLQYSPTDGVLLENGMTHDFSVEFADGRQLSHAQLVSLLQESGGNPGGDPGGNPGGDPGGDPGGNPSGNNYRPKISVVSGLPNDTLAPTGASPAMLSGYEAYNSQVLQQLHDYFIGQFAPGQIVPARISLGNLGGACATWNVVDVFLFSQNSVCCGSFDAARSWRPVRFDPLVLDLDRDGIETVGTGAGVFFDHNGNGIKTGTGWINADDGLLARDQNGNDSIDDGRELFGDQTMLQNGATAATGFAAVGDLDTNSDGRIDGTDEAFSELKIWRDLNQDGISQANELANLVDLDISSINLGSSTANWNTNGNTISKTGTFTRTDGTTGIIADVSLAAKTYNREFTSTIDIPERLAALPDIKGTGNIRDLREAAATSLQLEDTLSRFSTANTRNEQMALLDQLLKDWADTSGLAGSLEERASSQYRVEYTAFGNIQRYSHLTRTSEVVSEGVTNSENPLIDKEYRNLILQWNERIHILEAFNGSYFFKLPDQSLETVGAVSGMQLDYSGYSSLSGRERSKPGLAISYSQPQLDQLEASYEDLRNTVYASLILQTRLKDYLNLIELDLGKDTVSFDFSKLNQAFQDKLAADPLHGLTDLIEFNRYTGGMLGGTSWDGVVTMAEILRSHPLTPELMQLYQDLDVSFNATPGEITTDNIILGDSSPHTLLGYGGNDILLGGTGDEAIAGGIGNDTLSGGAGNDRLFGETGNDTYIFCRGYGNDQVQDFQGRNSIVFSGLKPTDITVMSSGTSGGNLVFRINDSGETLTTVLDWNDWYADEGQGVGYFFFSDGTVWDKAEVMRQSLLKPTEGDDSIFDSHASNTILGLGGNDIIVGNGGNDILDGGTGDDTLFGSAFSSGQSGFHEWIQANGNDTYIFGRGYGHDTIIDGDRTLNSDRLKFKDDISPADIGVMRVGLDLVLTIEGTDDRITLQKYFFEDDYRVPENRPYEIEKIEFADGTIWTAATLRDFLLTGSDNPETIIGYRGDDGITGNGGSDSIEGRGGNDIIFGGQGDDTIHAGAGRDIIDGGAGDDMLNGNANLVDTSVYCLQDATADNDTYLFGHGDGHDIIRDYDWRSGNEDTIRFKDGIKNSDIRFEHINNRDEDLRIVLDDGADTITVKNWFGYHSNFYVIERLEFADGTALDPSYIETHLTKIGTTYSDTLEGSSSAESIMGYEGNDALYGEGGDDILDGGNGDDLLNGGPGNDTYLFNRGSGCDTVIEDDSNSENINRIVLGPDLDPEDITVYRSGNNMILSIDATEDRLIIMEGFNDNRATKVIEEIHFADGQVWDYTALQGRAILPVNGGGMSEGDDIIFGTPNADNLAGGEGNDLLFGMDSDDYIVGGNGRDRLDGGNGNDTLLGGIGDDLIFGGIGDDVILSGPGNDIAWGGKGSDTYIFRAGDGRLTIEDTYREEIATGLGRDYGGGVHFAMSFAVGGDDSGTVAIGGDGGGDGGGTVSSVNVLQFGQGIALADLCFRGETGYLVIDIPSTGDQLKLAGYAPDRPTFTNAVDIFRFFDGSEATREDLLGQGINITGTNGNDSFLGKPGNDRLEGGSGNDKYFFNLGDGIDTIIDIAAPGMENSISFGVGITAGNLRAVNEAGTLVLLVGDGGDAIRFEGYNPDIPGTPHPVGQFYFGDGSSISFFDLLNGGYEYVGTPEQDVLTGTPGNDLIRGLADNDLLAGGIGDDIYLFSAADGVDTIDDIAGPGEGNTVILPNGSALDHVRLSHDPDSHTLILTELETGNQINLTGFNRLDPSTAHAVEYFRFGMEGAVVTYEELLLQGFDIRGGNNNDNLLGTSLNDRIYGSKGDDIFASGTGNDFLFGQEGNDTYIFNQGDGILTITDKVETGAGNILRFGPGIEPEDLRRHIYFEAPTESAAGALIIAFDNGDEVRLTGFNPSDVTNSPRSVDTFVFANGTILSFTELAAYTFIIEGDGNDNTLFGTNLSDRLYGRDGHDNLSAGMGSDVLTGATGNDLMAGGEGRDIYVVNIGDGVDRIKDTATDGIGNSILFHEGISRENVILTREGTTLSIGYDTLGSRLLVENFDPTGVSGSLVVDTFEFADGSTVKYQELVNHAPVAGNTPFPDLTLAEDQPFLLQLPYDVFRDIDGDPLLYNAEVSGYGRIPDWLQFDRATGIFSGTPDNDDVQSFTLTVSAFDPLGTSASRSFAVVVANINDAPSVNKTLSHQLATEDQPFTFQIPTDTFRDIDFGDKLALSAALANGNPLPAWLAFDAATRTFFGTPDNDQVGTAIIKLIATDQFGAAADTELTLEVINVNDAPELAEEVDILLQDVRETDGQILASDPDGDKLDYWLSSGPNYGNFILGEQGAWQYLPNALFIGTDTVMVAVDDDNGGVSSTTLTFDVRVSTPFIANQTLLLDEDSGLKGVLSVTNPVGGSLSYQLASNASHGLFLFDENGTWSYIPEKNFHGEEQIQIQVVNEYGLASTATLTMTVASVNDIPTVPMEERFVMLGIPTLGGRIDAGDGDGDPLRYALSGAPVHGIMTLNKLGQWQYTPANGFYGEDRAEVTISDGAGGEAKTTLCFVVNIYEDGDVVLPEKTVETLYLNDIAKADLTFDKDGDALTIEIRQHGTIRVTGYFSAPDKGLKTIETSDGPINLAKDYIVDARNGCSVLNGAIHGLLGDQLLVCGTACSDTLLGAMKNDVVFGSASGDCILGLAGNDLLAGGTGNDALYGNYGNDTLYGDLGNDSLSGDTGDDFLVGGKDSDQLFGGSGSDHLVGGLGNDILTGGVGNDLFVFDTTLNAATNRDLILDFTSGQDKIELYKDIFSALPAKASLASCSFLASASGDAADDNDYILYNTASGALLYDADGNGQGVAVEFATLTHKPTIKAEDFVIVA